MVFHHHAKDRMSPRPGEPNPRHSSPSPCPSPLPLHGVENRDIARYETTAVYTHPDAKVDIVLVHGLNGDPKNTWTNRDNGVFWPLDLLPRFLGEHAPANILVYGYNADVCSSSSSSSSSFASSRSRSRSRSSTSPSDNFIHQHAQTLVTSLTQFRVGEGTSRNPILWVCHSLGGVLVKRALLYSHDLRGAPHQRVYRSISVSTFGIVFLGTPHAGADAAGWALMLQGMAGAVVPRKLFESESVLLRTLKRDSETLANINNHFLDIYQRFRIHMAHENHKTDVKGTKIIIVDANSAGPQLAGVTYYGVEATHSQMCKFASTSAPGFRTLATDVREWVIEAPAVVQGRWEIEDEENDVRMWNEINEQRMASPMASRVDVPTIVCHERPQCTTSRLQLPAPPANLRTFQRRSQVFRDFRDGFNSAP